MPLGARAAWEGEEGDQVPRPGLEGIGQDRLVPRGWCCVTGRRVRAERTPETQQPGRPRSLAPRRWPCWARRRTARSTPPCRVRS